MTPIAVSAVDSEGNTVLMALAARDSRETVRRLLISQAAAEIHAFDLSAKNIQGKNLLHLLVQNDDKYSVGMVLDQLRDSGTVLNCVDCSGLTPLMVAYTRGFYGVSDVIVNHPKQRTKIDWSIKDNKGRSLTQQAEEAKKGRLQVQESGIIRVKVKRKTLKRKDANDGGTDEVKGKQAKVSNEKAALQVNGNATNVIYTNGVATTEDVHMEDISEEVSWIQQMKRDKEEANRKAEEEKKLREEKEAKENKRKVEGSNESKEDVPKALTQHEKWLALKARMEEEKNKENTDVKKVSQAEQLENIAEAMEKKRLRKMAARNKM